MKSLAAASLLAFLSSANAHYTFPQFILPGNVNASAWQYTRETVNWQNLEPLQDPTSGQLQCYQSGSQPASAVASIAAGSKVGFTVNGNPSNLYHPGYLDVYMAAASDATSTSAGTGSSWFKIYELSPVFSGNAFNFPSEGLTEVFFTVPSEVPSGQYLIRVEHIALHIAQSYGGAQYYLACAQVEITGGGSGTPGPLVAFPGAYTGYEPGILIDIYGPFTAGETYTAPGPAVWPAAGGGSPTTPVSKPTTTAKPSSPTSTKPVSPTSAKPTSTPVTGTVPLYGQCGGEGYTGATACASGTCTVSNPYYSQCLPS